MNKEVTNPLQCTLTNKSNNGCNTLSVKIILIAILILLLFIPMILIQNLISEREYTAKEAIEEVHQKWSGIQMIVGPVITIPYKSLTTEGKTIKCYLNYLPEQLEIESKITTEELKRGLYEIIVYNSPVQLKGRFIPLNLKAYNLKPEDILQDEITINIGISDVRGIKEQVILNWGNKQIPFNPGIAPNCIVQSGVFSKLEPEYLLSPSSSGIDFSVMLQLKGSESLMFAPLGKTTTVQITSNCITPSFTGAFLPSEREVTETGFTSQWKVLDLNRNFSQVLQETNNYSDYDSPQYVDMKHSLSSFLKNHAVKSSVFGVKLLLPVHQYQKATRSVKYAFLIIILTFVVSFFVEITQKRNIHPFQYLLIGLALCLFYTLLIATSEHTHFTLAYWLSTLMTVGLITLYMLGILKIKKTAYTIGSLLLCLYTYIFFLIQLETYALLAGSIGLFIILAIIMYYSQKINWYNNR